MADAATVIGIIGGVVGVVGGGGGLVGLWRVWVEERRAVWQRFFASYDRSIQLLREQHQRESDPAKKEAKGQQLETLENEYQEQLEAYRQNCALRQSAPRGALTAERRPPSESARIELTERLEKARPLSPALLTAEDYFLRGNALYQLGRYEEALASYNAALTLRPDDTNTLGNRGRTLRILGRYEEALADYTRSLELRPDDPDALNNRGFALTKMGRLEEALVDLDRSLNIRHEHAGIMSSRALALAKLGQQEQAFADFARALALKPGDASILYDRACAFSVAGRWDESLQDLAAAFAGTPRYRTEARQDMDLEALRDHPEWGPKFWELVGKEEEPS